MVEVSQNQMVEKPSKDSFDTISRVNDKTRLIPKIIKQKDTDNFFKESEVLYRNNSSPQI